MSYRTTGVSPFVGHLLFDEGVNRKLNCRPIPGSVEMDGPRYNPAQRHTGKRGNDWTVTMIVGLRPARPPLRRLLRAIEFSPADIRAIARRRFGGGSVVTQAGWWGKVDEKSAKLTIEFTGTEADFKERVGALTMDLLDDLRQEALWYDIYLEGTKIFKTEVEWQPGDGPSDPPW